MAADPDAGGDGPPAAAESFRVGRGEIEVPARRLETLGLADEYGVEAADRGDWTSVTFGEGEEVPPELAEMWWSAFSDKLVGFDAEDEVVSPATSGSTGFRLR